MNKMNKK